MTWDRGMQIIGKAKGLGAAIAGVAIVESLQESPSHKILGKYGTKIDGVHSFEGMIDGFNEIKWPAKAKSDLVIGVPHPQDEPELDWTHGSGNTPGNQILQEINPQEQQLTEHQKLRLHPARLQQQHHYLSRRLTMFLMVRISVLHQPTAEQKPLIIRTVS